MRRPGCASTGAAAFRLALAALLAAAPAVRAEPPPYRIVDGKVDAATYDGYRLYHAGCNHCHGPDGIGSSFGPSLIARPLSPDAFRAVVLEGSMSGGAVMKGYAADPNFAGRVDELYAYLRARADGALGRGRPQRRD